MSVEIIEGRAPTSARRRVAIGDLRQSHEKTTQTAPTRDDSERGEWTTVERSGSSILLTLFVVSLFIPMNLDLGGLRVSPYRIFLLFAFIPMAIKVFSGRAGGTIAPDVLMVLYCLWAVLTLFVNHPVAEIVQAAGIFVIESLGAYLLGRACVRSAADMARVARTFCVMLAILAPFVAIEALTGRRILAELAPGGLLGPATPHYETRWGMTRAGWPMEHPILLGVVASMGLSLGWFGVRPGRATPLWALPSVVVAFFSLSLGAYVSVALQLGLIAYERFTRWLTNRWWLLAGAVAGIVLFLSVASNRGPFVIVIDLFAFNDLAAWTRVAAFRHVTEVIAENPLIGLGMNDWRKPGWFITESIDNFWYVIAVRHGLPALAILIAACVIVIVAAGRTRLDRSTAACRYALALTLVGVMVTIFSVHLWNASYTLFVFLLGSTGWLFSASDRGAARLRSLSAIP